MNALTQVSRYGQSIWLDYIDRNLVRDGLARMIAEDDLRGVTSNPAIFEKAIGGDPAYRADLSAARGEDLTPAALLERLVMQDIRGAADLLRPVYLATAGRDGYVSLEVPPALSRDADATIGEARRLWRAVARENLMIKVPATEAGLRAITVLIADGINVNVTLLFARSAYTQVAEAYLAGLEQRSAAGLSLEDVASVASFFISRIDTQVDALLSARMQSASSASERESLSALLGKAAIANAKLTYRDWQSIFASPRWQTLADMGAHAQRLLWASTGVKNSAYRDVRYIEALIGPGTVNTAPPATIDAFRDHGRVRATLEDDREGAAAVLEALESHGISLDELSDRLLDEGLQLFTQSWDQLLGSISRWRLPAR